MRIRFFEKEILCWFRQHGRSHLPWRKPGITAYQVWVSEIMLQQTQVSRVIDYYTRFLERFPTVQDLSRATWEEFLPYYAGLGYYRRGQNMLLTARIIEEKYHGRFPNNKKELMALPGVGDYTARAILSFAYGDDHLAWDTNLQKVFGRYFFGNKQADFQRDKFETHIRSEKKQFNAAVMDFASTVCTTKPKCSQCPLKDLCEYALSEGLQEPMKKKKVTSFPAKDAQVYIFLHKEHKLYYSSVTGRYKPFVLPARSNTRAKIKTYFEEMYGLELAVRPPHKKVYIESIPTLFVNAQILLGDQKFEVFDKGRVGGMIEMLDITEEL